MAVDKSNFEVTDLNHFSLREVWILIKFSFDNVGLALCGGKILEPFDSLKSD